MMLQPCFDVREIMAKMAQPEKRVSDAAVADVSQLMESCGYSAKVNPTLFATLSRFGASEVEHTTKRGLFIKGDAGIGKSCGLQILAKQFGWQFMQATEIEGYYSTQPTYEQWEWYCRACDFFGHPKTLVIDDLGTEKYPYVLYGSPANPLAELLEIRYRISYHRDNVRTVVTCNLTDEQIKQRYGFRIFDRMSEMFAVVSIHGASARR